MGDVRRPQKIFSTSKNAKRKIDGHENIIYEHQTHIAGRRVSCSGRK